MITNRVNMQCELETGWLAPSGDFYPCGVYEHFSCARKLLNDKNAYRPDEKLYDAGFAQITISQLGAQEWCVYWKHFLTDAQKNFLRPYFDEEKICMSSIVKAKWIRETESR